MITRNLNTAFRCGEVNGPWSKPDKIPEQHLQQGQSGESETIRPWMKLALYLLVGGTGVANRNRTYITCILGRSANLN